jgi:hypothetical protein
MCVSARVAPAEAEFPRISGDFISYRSRLDFPFGALYDPVSRQTDVIAHFEPDPQQYPARPQLKVPDPEVRKQLVRLLACSEQIENRAEIIEAILECEEVSDSVFDSLSRHYHKVSLVLKCRYESAESDDRRNEIELGSGVLDLFQHLKKVYMMSGWRRRQADVPVLDVHLTEKLFLLDQTMIKPVCPIAGGPFLARGIASNGQFLFLLRPTSELLIWSLLNGAVCSTPVSRVLDIAVDGDSSLIISADSLMVHTATENCYYSIGEFFSGDTLCSRLVPSLYCPGHRFACNGLSALHYGPDGDITVIDPLTFTDLRKVKCPRCNGFAVMTGSVVLFMEPNTAEALDCVLYSLINGVHIWQGRIDWAWNIETITMDSINACVWFVGKRDGNKMELCRLPVPGSGDPLIIDVRSFRGPRPMPLYRQWIGELEMLMMHFLGHKQNVGPDDFRRLVEYGQFFCSEFNRSYSRSKFGLLRIVTVLADLGISKNNVTVELFRLIGNLPEGLGSFLFFSSFDLLIDADEAEAFSLLERFLLNEAAPQAIGLHMKKLETSTKLGFLRLSPLYRHVPCDLTPCSSVPKPFLSFLLLHQQLLISETYYYFKRNDFAGYSSQILELFADYCEMLFGRCHGISMQNRDFGDSVIFFLAKSFLSLLTVLTGFHQVAAVAADFFPKVLPQVAVAVAEGHTNLGYFLYLSAQFLTTLIGGGVLTKLESDFPLLIRSNLQFDKTNILSPEVGTFANSDLNSFLAGEMGVMAEVYKYKHRSHQNLSDELRRLDRVLLAAFAWQANVLDELIVARVTTTMKMLIDQMIRVRNAYRRLKQIGESTKDLIVKALMLLRLNSGCNVPKLLGDFVIFRNSPESILAILERQQRRIESAFTSFSFVV